MSKKQQDEMNQRKDKMTESSNTKNNKRMTLSEYNFDSVLKESMKEYETPSQELTADLIQQIFTKSAVTTKKQVSLWFLPVVLNIMISSIVVVLSMIFVTNSLLCLGILFGCSFSIITTSLFTYVGMKSCNLKTVSMVTI